MQFQMTEKKLKMIVVQSAAIKAFMFLSMAFLQRVVFENFEIFPGKHLRWSLF